MRLTVHALVSLAGAALWVAACSGNSVLFTGEGGGGAADTGGNVAATGGGDAGSSQGGEAPARCNIDCSTIVTYPCTEAVCNESSGNCEVVDSNAGAACDDDSFCTVADVCDGAGTCVPGPPNDCGMTAGACQQVACDETSATCSIVAGPNGQPCTSTNLCLLNASCLNGTCSGGLLKDCAFSPVPNECHESVCDPQTGQCVAQPDPSAQGQACTDPSAPCTVSKTCDNAGNCIGGQPKDCSAFNAMCFLGQCNTANGQCYAQPVLGPCDDQNPCTTGESCQAGMCGNGTPVTTCSLTPDGCCPPGCNPTNDAECTPAPTGTVRLVNGGFVPVQYELCGSGIAGQCTPAAAEASCAAQGMRVVSHASDGTPGVFSLGATSSCYWSISYFTVNQTMPSNACLTGISNLYWSAGCCLSSNWHGNTVHFGPANQTFGYVSSGDSGYVAANPNVSGTTWGCMPLNQTAYAPGTCTTDYVACTP